MEEALTRGRHAPPFVGLHIVCHMLQLCSRGVGGMVVAKVLRMVGNARCATHNEIGNHVQRAGCAGWRGGK